LCFLDANGYRFASVEFKSAKAWGSLPIRWVKGNLAPEGLGSLFGGPSRIAILLSPCSAAALFRVTTTPSDSGVTLHYIRFSGPRDPFFLSLLKLLLLNNIYSSPASVGAHHSSQESVKTPVRQTKRKRVEETVGTAEKQAKRITSTGGAVGSRTACGLADGAEDDTMATFTTSQQEKRLRSCLNGCMIEALSAAELRGCEDLLQSSSLHDQLSPEEADG
jgi:hypothetical protein